MTAISGFVFTTIVFLAVITIIIFVHELGHFMFARLFGVRVREFAIGFGKKLLSRQKGDTEYTVRAVPLGGFVDLKGIDPSEEDSLDEDSFSTKPGYARLLVLLAGPVMNFILAFLLFVIMASVLGTMDFAYSSLPVIGSLAVEGPAGKAGIKPGDMIISIAGFEVSEFDDIIDITRGIETATFEISLIGRDGAESDVIVSFAGFDMAGITRDGEAAVDVDVATEDVEAVAGDAEAAAAAEQDIAGDGDDAAVEDGDAAADDRGHRLMIAPDYEPVVEVMPGQPAARAGMRDGDRVISIDDKKIRTWGDLPAIIGNTPEGENLHIVVRRNGELSELNVIPEWSDSEDGGISRIGITPSVIIGPPVSPGPALIQGALETYYTTRAMIQGLWALLAGSVSADELSGPVGIAGIVGHRARQGLPTLFRIVGLLSINIGLINLIPFPALDGSRIMFILLEIISRKKLSSTIEERIHWAGLVVLITLMIWITGRDIINLII